MTQRNVEQTTGEQAKTALAENPVAATAAIGAIVQGVGLLLGWDATTQAAAGAVALNAAVLIRLGVLAWKDARR